MKRKIKKGLKLIEKLIEKKELLKKEYRSMVYAMRSYSFMIDHQFKNAYEDIKTYFSQNNKNNYSMWYNKCICEGILSLIDSKYESSLASFSKANEKYIESKECFVYKALVSEKQYINTGDTKHI